MANLPSVSDVGVHSTGHNRHNSDIHVQDDSEPALAAPSPSNPLEDVVASDDNADNADSSSDSGFDSESLLGDETDTLASSIMHYRMENGRQYHSYCDGAYWGPNDEHAKEILDFAHHMYLLTLDHKLHLAPVSNPQRILDVGTGTGIWAIDAAGSSLLFHAFSLSLSLSLSRACL